MTQQREEAETVADCEYYEELMARLVDEPLSPEEERDLRAHLRTCPDCARLFRAFSAMTTALREEPMAEPPARLVRGVMEQIAAETEDTAPRRARKGSVRSLRSWIGLGAAACLVLAAVGSATLFWRQSKGAATAAAPQNLIAGVEDAQEDMAAPEEEAGTADIALARGADMPLAAAVVTPEPEPLQVCDVAGNPVGVIPPQSIPAFAALLEGGEVIGGSEGDWSVLFSVDYEGASYFFATGEDAQALIWWDNRDTPVTRSPGALADLQALLDLAPAATPY